MIHFEDGGTARIAGRHLAWDGGNAPLAEITVTPLDRALPIDISAIRPPVMYAAVTIDGETRRAAMPLADYQTLAIMSARARGALASPGTAPHRVVNLVAPILARAGQAVRRACGACGKR
jgi:hypothetical protein